MFVVITLTNCSREVPPQSQAGSQPLVASPSVSPSPAIAVARLSRAEQIQKEWPSQFRFITQSIEKKHEGNRSYEISVDYPQITGIRTPPTRRFNRWIRRKIHGYVNEFKALERAAEVKDRRNRLPRANISEALGISYRIYYSDDLLISLRLTHSVMALGQMHPIDYYETINYDLKKGRPLRERDVFKRGYLKVCSEYSRKELKEKYELMSSDEWSRDGTAPLPENFKNWNITPDGILISFEDYQIGPHSFGQAELIIPYPTLRPVMKASWWNRNNSSDGPLAKQKGPDPRNQTKHHEPLYPPGHACKFPVILDARIRGQDIEWLLLGRGLRVRLDEIDRLFDDLARAIIVVFYVKAMMACSMIYDIDCGVLR